MLNYKSPPTGTMTRSQCLQSTLPSARSTPPTRPRRLATATPNHLQLRRAVYPRQPTLHPASLKTLCNDQPYPALGPPYSARPAAIRHHPRRAHLRTDTSASPVPPTSQRSTRPRPALPTQSPPLDGAGRSLRSALPDYIDSTPHPQ